MVLWYGVLFVQLTDQTDRILESAVSVFPLSVIFAKINIPDRIYLEGFMLPFIRLDKHAEILKPLFCYRKKILHSLFTKKLIALRDSRLS